LFFERIPKPCNTLPGCPTSLCQEHLRLTLTGRVLFPTPVFRSPTIRLLAGFSRWPASQISYLYSRFTTPFPWRFIWSIELTPL
jgi:hypothetical protein